MFVVYKTSIKQAMLWKKYIELQSYFVMEFDVNMNLNVGNEELML